VTVLVVDDDPIILESCRRVLEAEGFTVSLATSAAEGLEALEGRAFDLLLADIKMPEVDGLQLLALARKRHPRVPVLLMSGYPTSETVAATMEGGADGFLAKPFTPEELVSAVVRAARPSRESPGPAAEHPSSKPQKG
jgi:DNA-binding NtrC family response regulator